MLQLLLRMLFTYCRSKVLFLCLTKNLFNYVCSYKSHNPRPSQMHVNISIVVWFLHLNYGTFKFYINLLRKQMWFAQFLFLMTHFMHAIMRSSSSSFSQVHGINSASSTQNNIFHEIKNNLKPITFHQASSVKVKFQK